MRANKKSFLIFRPTDSVRFVQSQSSGPLQVNFSVILIKIAELNSKKETIDLNFFVELNWTDPFLEWNPEDYDGVERVVMPAKAIPLPVVAVFGDEGPG